MIKKENRGDKTDEVDVLLEQYKVAVELYRHEDVLNWTKMNHLFYINGALWAIIGLSLGDGTSILGSSRFVMAIVCTSGIIVCLALGIALWFGTIYMEDRKVRVINIEEELTQYGGKRVVSRPISFVRKSPTIWMLRLVPILLLIVWIVILVNYV